MSKTVLVTGGTRGIGHAISAAMAKAGYKVAANYAGNEEAAKATADELGIHVYKFDVADYDAVGAGVAAIEKDLGPIDIVVNNAGITRDAPFHKMTKDQWQQGDRHRSDLRFQRDAPCLGRHARAQLGPRHQHLVHQRPEGPVRPGELFRRQGRPDRFQQGPRPGRRQEGHHRERRVCPGYIDTEMVRAVPEKVLEGIIATIPVGRLGKPEEIASMCAYLASDDGAFITGATMTVNGAQYIAG
jgi:acetoacetyl-CoA reductase